MRKILLLGAALSWAGAAAASGTLVVAGDATIAFRFNSGVQTGAAAVGGNVTFMENLLGGSDTVAIFGGPSLPDYSPQLEAGFNGLGKSVTRYFSSDAITADRLAGNALVLAFFPSRDFTADEAGALLGFLEAGGTVFLAGESTNNAFGNPFGAAANARLNGLLAALGSAMSLEVNTLDLGDQFATVDNGRVLTDPLAQGVLSFGYGLTTTVAGGTPLFLTTDLLPFLSYERIAAPGVIPEPATWALLIAGFGLVGGTLRRRRKAAA
jgi:hypothetical protein